MASIKRGDEHDVEELLIDLELGSQILDEHGERPGLDQSSADVYHHADVLDLELQARETTLAGLDFNRFRTGVGYPSENAGSDEPRGRPHSPKCFSATISNTSLRAVMTGDG